MLEDASPAVVLMDMNMPQMSGLDVIKQVHQASPRTPTILMTAYGDPKDFSRAYESAGVFRYLTKPWDNFDLLVTVREALKAAAALEPLTTFSPSRMVSLPNSAGSPKRYEMLAKWQSADE